MGEKPDLLERLEELRLSIFRCRPWFLCCLRPAFEFVGEEFANGVLSVVVKIGAELVEDLGAFFAAGFLITWGNGRCRK